jgi:dihydrofolate synthase/folylpolyglutamate synthase
VAKGRPLQLVLGMLANKDAGTMLDRFAPLAESLVAVPVPGHDHHAPADLTQAARARGLIGAEADDLPHALNLIAQRVSSPPLVLILGSLYLAGAALAQNDEMPD